MKAFWGFVIKEFYHIFRDKRTLLILFGVPVIEMLLFGFVLTNEIKRVNIAICDLAKDEITNQIISRLASSKYFNVVEFISNPVNIENVFRKGKIKEIVIFEPDFSKRLVKEGKANIQLISDASDANFSNLVVTYTQGVIQIYNSELNKTNQAGLGIVPEIKILYNPELKGVYFFVPGIMALILMLISALMTSISIVREKELGTMEVLLVSPLKPIQIIIGKVLPYASLSFVNAIIIIVMGYLVFGLPVKGSILLLLFESLLFIIMALSLGILISAATESQMIAMMLSMVALMLPTILLSGFIFPIENMPTILQWLCQIMPPKYFIVIVKNIMLMGNGLVYIWQDTLVLLFFTIFFIGLATKKFKIRLA